MSEADSRELEIGEELAPHTPAQILAIYEGKLAIRRRLADIDPTNPQWRCDEAGILATIGIECQNAGLSERAIRAFQEGCAILRELAARDPRNSNLQRHLSTSLAELAKAKLDIGDFEGALTTQEERLLLDRKLRKRGMGLAQQLAAAENLASVGDLRLNTGNHEGALEAYEELVPIERQLVRSDPHNTCLRWNLSRSLDRLGDLRLADDNATAALSAYEESLSLRHGLIELDSTDASLREEVCWNLKKIGDLKRKAGDNDGAHWLYEERLRLTRRLSEANPEDDQWHLKMSVSLEDVAAMRLSSGDRDAALQHYSESLVTRRQLATVGQPDFDQLRDLCLTLEATASLSDEGTALSLYEESLRLRRQLTEAQRFDIDLTKERLNTVERIADLRFTSGDNAGALVAYDEMLSLHRDEHSEPDDMQRQKNVWSDLNKIADLKLRVGDIDGALTASEESLTVSKNVLRLEKAGSEWSSQKPWHHKLNIGAIIQNLSNSERRKEQAEGDLALSLDRLCGVKFKAGDISGALAAYEELIQHEYNITAQATPKRRNLQSAFRVLR
jgi:tetratricopeptide (TPR) repeat protein